MKPNILFIIWDACRLDVAREHAPNLSQLAERNLWFENAIAPAGYSLPSHVSMFTGEYPSEHGIHRQTQMIDDLPLVRELGDTGYSRYGVSANGFASARYGFDKEFDEFYNTQGQMVFPDGLDVHKYIREIHAEKGEFNLGDINIVDGVHRVIGHDHPLKSAANVFAALLQEIVGRFDVLQRIPHRRFNQYSEFNYSPEKNTTIIRRLLDEVVEEDTPFFIFTNYMDAHHPYAPPADEQRRLCGRKFSYRELAKIAKITHPLTYLQRLVSGEDVDDGVVEAARNLYAGEVRTADLHLGHLLDELEAQGLRGETLIVVTADHGENLGETDAMGEQRFGHVASVSDHLMRVPLVIAHPELEGRSVQEYESLKDLYHLLKSPGSVVDSAGGDLESLMPTNAVVSGQLPGSTGHPTREKYPEIGELLERHMVATYFDDWKVVLTSTSKRFARRKGESRSLSSAPEEMVATARRQLDKFVRESGPERELTQAERSHLEALGYL